MIYFYFIVLFVVAERLLELNIASKNERWMKAKGAIEVGKNHYKYFILLHSLFFICLIVEAHYANATINFFFFGVFLLAQVGRIWCILSLGRFWNTKIIILPNVLCIKKGPYKYIKHPNYVIVFIELFVIPAMFGAYVTAILFPITHLFLLTIRIPEEEKALGRRI